MRVGAAGLPAGGRVSAGRGQVAGKGGPAPVLAAEKGCLTMVSPKSACCHQEGRSALWLKIRQVLRLHRHHV